MDNKDYIIRATAADNQIRAFAATTRGLVEQARQYHNTSPVATAALGRLLTAGSMMGVMMKGERDLLTLQIKSQSVIGGITVTADSKGRVKGYVNEPMVILPPNEQGKLDVRGATFPGTLSIIKDIGMKEPYVGTIDLVSGEIAEDLTYYFASSEQVPSVVALGVLMNGNSAGEDKVNTVRQAGGLIIQLMPNTDDEVIDKLEAKIASIDSVTNMLNTGMSPEDILEEVLGDMGLTISEKTETGYFCNCSRERVERAVISIGKKEISSLIEEEKSAELNCQFCNTHYVFDIEDLKKLLEKSR